MTARPTLATARYTPGCAAPDVRATALLAVLTTPSETQTQAANELRLVVAESVMQAEEARAQRDAVADEQMGRVATLRGYVGTLRAAVRYALEHNGQAETRDVLATALLNTEAQS